jgi:REP element-mobilizing transposase RayT
MPEKNSRSGDRSYKPKGQRLLRNFPLLIHLSPMELAHGKNLRTGRWSEPGQIYLVTATTRDRRPAFTELTNGRILVNALRWSDDNQRTRTWAFVVMPDHLHWLFELGTDASLSRVVASVKKFSTRQINARSGRTGSIWQAGFHDHALRQEEDMRQIARYVVMNPVRAGLVRSVRGYSFWDVRWI